MSDLNALPKINQSLAIEKAMKGAASCGENNPKLLRAELLTYQQARQQLPEPLLPTDNDERMNGFVWLVEMSGTFQSKHLRRTFGKNPLLVPKTKALILIGAEDGLLFSYSLYLS